MTALIVGGYDDNSLKTTEIISQGHTCSSNSLPSLSTGISWRPSLVHTSEEETLLCGGYGNEQKCLELKDNQWQEHSSLKNERIHASAVSTPGGIFIFGGNDSRTTWEWLPKGTNQWQSGNSSIPGGFWRGCAVKINNYEILLIGGWRAWRRVLKFDITTEQFTSLGDVLNHGRSSHSCIRFKDDVIITGGWNSEYLSSTEVIKLHDLTTAHSVGELFQARSSHGLVVVHFDNKETVLAVGGECAEKSLDSIEMWNSTTMTWTTASMKLTEPKDDFGILSLPARLVCS